VLLTKGVPIEATALLARQLPERLEGIMSPTELARARDFLYDPGISVLRDARVALAAGRVTAMHDPTEGGLATALWELAEASGHSIVFHPDAVPVPELARRVCQAFGLDPLAAIASGALLLTTPAGDAPAIRRALEAQGILCAEIGKLEDGPVAVWVQIASRREPLTRPERDEIAKVFAS
jgi:hydrogenase maturation factor